MAHGIFCKCLSYKRFPFDTILECPEIDAISKERNLLGSVLGYQTVLDGIMGNFRIILHLHLLQNAGTIGADGFCAQ